MGFDEQFFWNGLTYLTNSSLLQLVTIFWFMLLFEVPRYVLTLGALSLAVFNERIGTFFTDRNDRNDTDFRKNLIHPPKISVLVLGHNEADVLEECVRSLAHQTLKNLEIVIASDGSTDDMVEVSRRLVHMGLAHRYVATDLRCGKSAAFNLGWRYCTGEIVINIDCDSDLEETALERVIAPILQDPNIGASSGNVIPRNSHVNILTKFQWIEYITTISVGRRVLAMFDQITVLSGAFSAFRRKAVEDIGGMDVGPGEDFDITLRLRTAGWKMAFVHDAVCRTAVPTSLWVLVRQRLRWERDSVRIRYRKNGHTMNPFSQGFKGSEAVHHIEYLFFNVFATISFPFYILYLTLEQGSFMFAILCLSQMVFIISDLLSFLLLIFLSGQWSKLHYIIYVPGFSIFNIFIMRMVRFWAYVEEWFLDASRNDAFCPTRARTARKW